MSIQQHEQPRSNRNQGLANMISNDGRSRGCGDYPSNCKSPLNKQLEEKDNQIKELTRENGHLQQTLQQNIELENQLQSRDQQISFLQAQAMAYQEDFESERRDRERAQSRIADLEMELSIVKRELHQYNLREMQNLQQRRQAALEFHRQEYERSNPRPVGVYASDGHRPRNDEEGEDEIDCI